MNNDYSKQFLDFCQEASTLSDREISKITAELQRVNLLDFCNSILEKNEAQKGVFTVLVTLLFYKYLYPKQDIRLHQINLSIGDKKGFSGRSFDTKYITPNLKKLGLPSMAESGWLTRSLEQAMPYDLNYRGKISGGVREAFLRLLDAVEVNGYSASNVLFYILNKSFLKYKENMVHISPLECIEINIIELVEILNRQFHFKYNFQGRAKLPMLAFYSIYQILIKELLRFRNCKLQPLGSYTASDRTSGTAGDLEVLDDMGYVEVVEIKLDIPINLHIINRVEEKIYRFNPKRYYVLSTRGIFDDDKEAILNKIKIIKEKHGCQVIVNGILESLKYYLRLIDNVNEFINLYSSLIANDSELKLEHKTYWETVILNLLQENSRCL